MQSIALIFSQRAHAEIEDPEEVMKYVSGQVPRPSPGSPLFDGYTSNMKLLSIILKSRGPTKYDLMEYHARL